MDNDEKILINSLEYHNLFEFLPVPESLKDKLFSTKNEKIEYFQNLNKVNIFIGENNSGKSYILREIIKSNIDEVYSKTIEDFLEQFYNQVNNSIFRIIENGIKSKLSDFNIKFSISYKGPIVIESYDSRYYKVHNDNTYLKSPLSHKLELWYNIFGNFNQQIINIEKKENGFHKYQILDKTNYSKVYLDIAEYFRNLTRQDSILDYFFKEINQFKYNLNKIYIHNFRTTFKEYFNDNLIDKINLEYNFTRVGDSHNETIRIGKHQVFIEYGKNLFDNVKNNILNSKKTRDNHLDFENFLSTNFFENEEVSISPVEATNKTDNTQNHKAHLRIKIGEQEERPIYELGTGLQMIIILTYPLFHYENGMIFIEEPELYLHPKLQRKLIEVYTTHERSKNFQFFIATHSNHIIDTYEYSDKVSVFTVEKEEKEAESQKFIIENVDVENTKALDLIGVRYSSLKVANCIIWVEGQSDRIYINKMLSIKAPKLKEGFHYQIMFYGGGLISHINLLEDDINKLINLTKINKNIIFVADRDTDNPEDLLKGNLNRIKEEIKDEERLWITDGREMEHYFMDIINQDSKENKIELTNKIPFSKLKYNKVDFANNLTQKNEFIELIENLKEDDNLNLRINNIIKLIQIYNNI